MAGMTAEEATKILGQFARFVDIEASIQDAGEDPVDNENWLKSMGWNMAKTGPELFEITGMYEMTRAEQRAKVQDWEDSGRLAHAPTAVKEYLEARGLLP